MRKFLLFLLVLPFVSAVGLDGEPQATLNISFSSDINVIAQGSPYYVRNVEIAVSGFAQDGAHQQVAEFSAYPPYIRAYDALYFVLPEMQQSTKVGYDEIIITNYKVVQGNREILELAGSISLQDISVEQKIEMFAEECLRRNISLDYVYGYRFIDNWQPYMWIEVGENGIPIDFAKDAFGYYEPDVVALKRSSAKDSTMISIKAESKNASISSGDPKIDILTLSQMGLRQSDLDITPHIYLKEAGFGSYNLMEIIVKNKMNYSVFSSFGIMSPDEVELLVPSKSFIFFEPNQVRRFYVPFRIKELAQGSKYRLSFKIVFQKHWQSYVNFTSYQDAPMITKEEVDKLVSSNIHVISAGADAQEAADILRKGGVQDVEQAMAQYQDTQDALHIEKQRDNNTVTIKLMPGQKLYNISIYENIPKCLAERIDKIIFESAKVTILNPDPLVMWHFDEISEDVDLHYSLTAMGLEDCENESTTLAVAQKISQQYLTARKPFNRVIPLLIIIPIIAALIYFSRFTPAGVSQKQDLALQGLVHYVKQRINAGHGPEIIEADLLNVGWPKKMARKCIKQAQDELAEIQKFIKY